MTQLQQNLAATQAELLHTREQLSLVDRQVSATDEVLNTPEGGVQKKLKLYDSEIRKLWDLANKRNRKEIASNDKEIKSIKAELKSSGKQFGDIRSELNKLSTGIKAEQTARTGVDSRIESLGQRLAKLERQQTQQGIATIKNKIAENEEAIVAIDAFRVQTNRSLTRLNQAVRELEQKLAGTTVSPAAP